LKFVLALTALHPTTKVLHAGSVLGKKYLGGLVPHHLGGNNEQNYCVQLSSIKQLRLCTVITLKIWGAWARFRGACAPCPQHRTATDSTSRQVNTAMGDRILPSPHANSAQPDYTPYWFSHS